MSPTLSIADEARAQLPADAFLCMGVVCPAHSKCARYLAIDGAPRDAERIASCQDGLEWPAFVEKTGAVV